MTLTTTGLAPVAAPDLAPESVRDTFGTRTDRPGALLLPLDTLAAVVAAVVATRGTAVWDLSELLVLVVGWPLALALAGSYSDRRGSTRTGGLRQVFAAAAGAAVALWVVVALAPGVAGGATARDVAAAALLVVGTAVAGSGAARALVQLVAPTRPVPVVLVGAGAALRTLLSEADRPARRPAFAPVAVCLSEATSMDELWPVPVRHGVEDHLLEVVHSQGAEGVVVVPGPGIDHPELRRWAAWLQDHDLPMYVGSGLRDVAPARIGTAAMGGAVLMRVRPAPLRGPGRVLKTVVDRVAAALLLVGLAPVLGVLAVLIRLDSPGRALYTQTRIGRGGRPFTVYKLRTMRADADRVRDLLVGENESDGVLFKIRRDPRITRLGALLRKYSLDELPQLINVVRGEMSLVGPRPALPSEVQAYDPDLRRRLVVRPGLTGLWQVSGRSELPWEETVRLDLQYVDNWSWSLDVRIAVRTFGAVLGHRGAY